MIQIKSRAARLAAPAALALLLGACAGSGTGSGMRMGMGSGSAPGAKAMLAPTGAITPNPTTGTVTFPVIPGFAMA